ncbi:MAG: hypothetical protein DRP35_05670 [Candidatus Zixiibacteriota bacterium]|nr:MAG: hypothetical protein DRP35_05670 [candidate division Zixibacteria bacterium]
MTKRFYYTDPNLLEFEASIVKSEKHKENWLTILDQTAFYPTSGGQNHDNGFLDDVEIVDVVETSDKNIVHISKEQIGDSGSKVKGKIDSKRRWHNRRLHTSQHIISNTFIKLFGYTTASVHLGEDYGAVELETNKLSEDEINKTELLVNQIILSNFQIEIQFMNFEDASKLPLRKAPKIKEDIRIIKIGDFEYSACGGTHCNATGEIGFIKFIETEKIRKRTLLKFLCGEMVLENYSEIYNITKELSNRLTCHHSDLISKIISLTNENKKYKKEIFALNKELMPLKINEILEKKEQCHEISYVVAKSNLNDQSLIANYSAEISERINGFVVLLYQNRIVISSNLPKKIQAGKFAKFLSSKISLKGGGNDKLAQMGGKENLDLPTLKEIIVKYLSNEI